VLIARLGRLLARTTESFHTAGKEEERVGAELFSDAGLVVLRRPRTGHEGQAADARTAQALPTAM
jgi:hypothetical protein